MIKAIVKMALEAFSGSYNIPSFSSYASNTTDAGLMVGSKVLKIKFREQRMSNGLALVCQSVKIRIHTTPVQTEKVRLSKQIMTCILILKIQSVLCRLIVTVCKTFFIFFEWSIVSGKSRLIGQGTNWQIFCKFI